MIVLWFKGLMAHRLPRLAAAGAGVALAVALMGSIGLFAAAGRQAMTHRAIDGLPVDWQVALAPGTGTPSIMKLLREAAPVTAMEVVDYAPVAGFSAATGGTTQTAGAGLVLGLPSGYLDVFPGQVRLLAGRRDGVLVGQQLAANLHAAVGDDIAIAMSGGVTATVTVDGIVDLPNAQAMLQSIDPARAAAQKAVPDDVLLLPAERWAALFATNPSPAGLERQIHVKLDHLVLPADPSEAYTATVRRAHQFELRAAGTATVADDLAARLDAVRADALYSGLLFLFLGAPGAVLAVILTMAVVQAGGDRRRREQALLRLRGASPRQVLSTAAVEAAAMAVGSAIAGAVLALGLAMALGIRVLGTGGLAWVVGAAGAGAAVALGAVLVPAWTDLWRTTVSAGRRSRPERRPLWERLGLDFLLLAVAAIIFWRSAGTGYQVVLAPEGVAAAAVDYTAFLAPLALWIGGGLLAARLCRLALGRGQAALARAVRPFARGLAESIAATVTRDGSRISARVVVTALAIAFGIAVSVFDTTYVGQQRVDAELTNGADVTVRGSAAAPAGDRIGAIRGTPGVMVAEPMQHRHAYVGQDLQDLYGIDAARIGQATTVADAYMADGRAAATLSRLGSTPDGVLVSQETVNDFQLAIGDTINLRLEMAGNRGFRSVRFHVVGVVDEFPTAPRDSFLVANAAYVAAETDSPGAELVLARVDGSPAKVAEAVRGALGTGSSLSVTDLDEATRLVGSSLTAVDLRRLAGIELGFALALVGSATGLVLALGFVERRRTLAVLWALGASKRTASRFLWAEGLVVLGGGLAFGAALGFPVAAMLVKLLGGVFDPPPNAMAVPWPYVLTLLATAVAAIAAAVGWAGHRPQSRVDLGAGHPR